MKGESGSEVAERIHGASLDLLDDPGVRIEHDEIAALLLSRGASPGQDSGVVRVPPEMIEEALAQCPRTVELTNRRGDPRVLSADGESSIWSTPGMYWDHRGEHRPFTSADMAAFARLLDRLETVDVVFGVSLDDVPPPARDVIGLKTIARNTSKHVRALCFSPDGAEVMAEMRAVVGDHPWFSVGFTAHGPLRWTRLALEIFRRTAGRGIPATVNGEPMAGVSGPVTLSGSAAVGNAEILAGIVINQLLEPGRPLIYNLGLAHVMDMRTAIAVTGGPENALFAQLSALMGRRYGLPSGSWVSTESMTCDAQAALEKMFGFASHLHEGVGAVWGVGQLESELTLSPAMAVIDDEMVRYVRRYERGVRADDDSLAVDVSRQVGVAGSFLDHEHTFAHFRSELFSPNVLFRQTRERWTEAGAKDLTERAEDRADELMAEAPDSGLTDDQAGELDRLADRFLARVAAES